jgi:leader peptidase (prepilin peptidase) / N-methyltransferase
MPTAEPVVMVVVVVVGLVVGSFLNVVIVRVPERRSVWRPRSACPSCGGMIAWYDNIPVLSYATLRGRCRACRAIIPWRYPVIELTTAALFLAVYLRFGLGVESVAAATLCAALVAVTAIDLAHQVIPDVITLPGIMAGIFASLATGRITLTDSVLGIVVGGGIFFVIILTTGGMGGGDMKLGAMLGAFLGWKVTLVALFLAVITGGAFAMAILLLGRKGRKDPIPFGPFLAAGGTAALFWGERLVRWYLDVSG